MKKIFITSILVISAIWMSIGVIASPTIPITDPWTTPISAIF